MTTRETPSGPSSPPHADAAAGSKQRRRIGEVLVEQGVLTADQLTAALGAQKDVDEGQPRLRLGQVIITRGFATERQIAEALAEALTLPLVDLGRTLVVPDAVRLLPRAVAERSGVLVLERDDNRLVVATSDPTNVMALDDVKLYTGVGELTVVVATDSQVRDHLARAWSLSEDSSDMSTMFQEIGQADEVEADTAAQAVEAAPIVRLVDVVLADAVRARASDVHVEPQAHDLRIRYRVDGLLRDVMTVPKGATAAAVSRIKIVSGLDIAERRKPQDGRAKLVVDGLSVEARISTLPTLHGEKVVIRLLPRAENVPQLAATGLTAAQRAVVGVALEQTQGLVLITGPTGSGKTNTLYAAIQQVSTPERNIVTLEDPVEVQVKGITQVQVNPKSGLTFAAGLRSVLRQDPDVVLVGEVRDHETAELALQASLTGHLVLTTLHTNDAVSAITRLVDMGVPPFLVASSLTLVVAQRLVRRPCAACAAPYEPTHETLTALGLRVDDLVGATPARGGGCSDCGGTGYRGRTGIFEVLPITASLRSVLLATPTEAAISATARAQGMATLRASAIAAAHRGETTYEEVLRATSVDSDSGTQCGVCARGLADDMLVCPWDGTPLRSSGCGACDRTLADDWTTCPWCRTPVTGHVVRQVAVRTVPLSRGDDVTDRRRTEVAAGTEVEAGTGIEADMQTEAGTEIEAGTRIEAGSEVEAFMQPEAGTEIEAGTATEAGTEREAGTATEAGTEVEAPEGGPTVALEPELTVDPHSADLVEPGTAVPVVAPTPDPVLANKTVIRKPGGVLSAAPITVEPDACAAVPLARTPDASGPPAATATELLPRLLVAHDDPRFGQALAAALAGRAEVRTAADASTALARMAAEPFAAVLLDDDLPDLSGIEVLEMLRADGPTAALPVLITGAPEDEDIARQAGADDYVALPHPLDELSDRLLTLSGALLPA